MAVELDFRAPAAWFAAPWPTFAMKPRSMMDWPGALTMTVPVLWFA